MDNMTDELLESPSQSVQEPAAAIFSETLEIITGAPVPKKRGRKPKSALPPAPPPPPPLPPVEVPKPRKRRTVVRMSRDDRAFSAAVASTEKDRAKCIDELSKIMEMWDVKQARLKALDWKISTLRGTSDKSAIAGMRLQEYPQPQAPGYPIPPQYPQPPAYPYPSAPAYIPPGMRTPSLPIVPGVPQPGGGAEGIVDDTDNEDPDKFLKVGGVIGGGGFV